MSEMDTFVGIQMKSSISFSLLFFVSFCHWAAYKVNYYKNSNKNILIPVRHNGLLTSK